MKEKFYVIGLSLITSYMAFSQQNQTGNPPPNNTQQRALYAWYRGGNPQIGNNNNTFGTRWNSPIYTITNSTTRSRLNGDINYTISGYNSQHNGYMLLGTQNGGNSVLYNGNRGPYSQLHITGLQGGATQSGYRPWMQTGVTFTSNNDIGYTGMRNVGHGVTEYTMAWGNNQGNNGDDMVFRFVRQGNGNNSIGSYDTANDIDGRHIARFTSRGLMGLGNTFGVVNGIGSPYIRPQSLLHLSHTLRNGLANEQYGFMQITYRANGNTIGTGETNWDGLRLGIDNDVFTAEGINYHNAYLRWQENSAFIIESDFNAINDDNAGEERVRVTNIFAPGVPNPSVNISHLPSVTRVGISARGLPLTQPRALLHIGEDIPANQFGLITQGWRNWMDYGTFTNGLGFNESENMYVGLLFNEIAGDRTDAVINWGDRHVDNNTTTGLLRFIYTTDGNNNTNSASNTQWGLEMMRISPIQDATTGNFGRVGVGDYTNINPTEKLDVDGNGRYRFIPADTADCLILGLHNDNTGNDNTFRRLDFTGDSTMVLQADGTWGPKGFPCWDINENGIQDPSEDVNSDGVWNGLDCGTDDQIITNFILQGNTLTLTIEDGNTVNVDLSQFLDNTDDQNLTGAVLDPNTNILTISIENGNPVSVDLSGIVGTTNITADNGLTLANNNIQWGGLLLHNTQVGMNNFNVLFDGLNDPIFNSFSIGSLNTGRAKLNVQSNAKMYGIYTKMNDNNFNISQALHGNYTEINSTTHSVFGNRIRVDVSNYNGGGWNYGEEINLLGGSTWNIGSQISVSSQNLSQENIGQRVSVYGKSSASIGAKYYSMGGVGNTGVFVQTTDANAERNYGISVLTRDALTHNIAISGIVDQATGSIQNIGVRGSVGMHTNVNTLQNYAGLFHASQTYDNSNTLYGVHTQANNGDFNSINYGIYSLGSGLGKLYGGYFSAEGQGTTNQIFGIYAKTYGTGVNGTWAGYFAGNLHASGNVTFTNTPTIGSDKKFKQNINDINNSLDIINKLQPKTYYFDTTKYNQFNFESDLQYGLIAQEVEEVIPSIVTESISPEVKDSLGNIISPQVSYKGIQYSELIPVLIGGIQEQQDIITTQDSTINVQDSLITNLNDRLTTLENCLSNLLPLLCQINNNMIQQNNEETQSQLKTVLNVELNDSRNIVLNQNVPNPFAEQTTISFNIPSSVNQAQIHFYDEKGNLIKTVELTERGNGQINVFASDLSTGVYTYTLVADGQIVATKRMIKVD